jgi:hypothetical protein
MEVIFTKQETSRIMSTFNFLDDLEELSLELNIATQFCKSIDAISKRKSINSERMCEDFFNIIDSLKSHIKGIFDYTPKKIKKMIAKPGFKADYLIEDFEKKSKEIKKLLNVAKACLKPNKEVNCKNSFTGYKKKCRGRPKYKAYRFFIESLISIYEKFAGKSAVCYVNDSGLDRYNTDFFNFVLDCTTIIHKAQHDGIKYFDIPIGNDGMGKMIEKVLREMS